MVVEAPLQSGYWGEAESTVQMISSEEVGVQGADDTRQSGEELRPYED